MKQSAKSKALVLARMKENKKAKPSTWDSRKKRGPWDRRPHKADGGEVEESRPLTDEEVRERQREMDRLNSAEPEYADGGAVDDWVTPAADDWVTPAAPATPSIEPEAADHGLSERQKLSPLQKAALPITSYPETYQRMNKESQEQVSHGIGQLTSPGNGAWETTKGLGNVAAGTLGYVASPITAAYRTVMGQPVEDVTGIPREYTEFAAQLATPGIGLPRIPGKAPAPVPVRPDPNGPLGVTLSEGQASGALPAIRTEQAALRGQMGSGAEAQAKAFAEQQAAEVAAARENVTKGLDPGRQVIAESPQEAAEMAAETVRREAARAKAGVKSAYDEAKTRPGEIHADAFRDMGDNIKTDITNRAEPIIIDDKLTPMASHMIRDVDDRIAKLQIQNRADPLNPNGTDAAGWVNTTNANGDIIRVPISGINLQGVEQVRKRLSQFRSDAYRSGNATDGRAAQAVLDAFDTRIDRAVNEGLFSGDSAAIKAWNAARAAHSDFKSTFAKGKNDPVGRVVERILGDRTNPAAIPNDVADFMYGATGTNPSSVNVGVANRVKKILGDQSPEWSAVKQGLFKRLTETGEGVTDFGSGKVAQRLNKFLNVDGKEMAAAVFSPAERHLLQEYADLHRALEVPRTGANWSETSTFVAPMMKKVTTGIAAVMGAMLGHAIAPGAYGVGELIGAGVIGKGSSAISDAAKARKVAAQMPIVANQMKQWQRAVTRNAKSNSTISKAGLGRASANLAASLGKIGFDPAVTLRQLQGAVPARAGEEDQKP